MALVIIVPALVSSMKPITDASAVPLITCTRNPTVGAIATPELQAATNLIQSRNFRSFEAYLIATPIYLALAMALRQLLNWAGPRFVFGR